MVLATLLSGKALLLVKIVNEIPEPFLYRFFIKNRIRKVLTTLTFYLITDMGIDLKSIPYLFSREFELRSYAIARTFGENKSLSFEYCDVP